MATAQTSRMSLQSNPTDMIYSPNRQPKAIGAKVQV
jgi:hypothetical protein